MICWQLASRFQPVASMDSAECSRDSRGILVGLLVGFGAQTRNRRLRDFSIDFRSVLFTHVSSNFRLKNKIIFSEVLYERRMILIRSYVKHDCVALKTYNYLSLTKCCFINSRSGQSYSIQ